MNSRSQSNERIVFPNGSNLADDRNCSVRRVLASFIDSMAGGGGIISVPIYFLAGLPAHLALGTNKLSAGIGTMVSTSRRSEERRVGKECISRWSPYH